MLQPIMDRQGPKGIALKLLSAARAGDAKTVAVQAKRAAKSGAIDRRLYKPLLNASLVEAARNGHVGAIKALVEAKADLNAVVRAATPAEARWNTPLECSALGAAALHGHSPAVRALLASGCEVSLRNSRGETPLMWAASGGNEACVREILSLNGDPNALSADGSTPIMWACASQNPAALRALIEAKGDIHRVTHRGETPLMWAALCGNTAVVRSLIGLKARLDIKSQDGATALTAAAYREHAHTARLLLNAGASVKAAFRASQPRGRPEARALMKALGVDIGGQNSSTDPPSTDSSTTADVKEPNMKSAKAGSSGGGADVVAAERADDKQDDWGDVSAPVDLIDPCHRVVIHSSDKAPHNITKREGFISRVVRAKFAADEGKSPPPFMSIRLKHRKLPEAPIRGRGRVVFKLKGSKPQVTLTAYSNGFFVDDDRFGFYPTTKPENKILNDKLKLRSVPQHVQNDLVMHGKTHLRIVHKSTQPYRDVVIQLPKVKSAALKRCVEYLRHHNGVPPPAITRPLQSPHMCDVCADPWDADFIDEVGANRAQLYELIFAANQLQIKPLVHLACAKLASFVKSGSPEALQDMLGSEDLKTLAMMSAGGLDALAAGDAESGPGAAGRRGGTATTPSGGDDASGVASRLNRLSNRLNLAFGARATQGYARALADSKAAAAAAAELHRANESIFNLIDMKGFGDADSGGGGANNDDVDDAAAGDSDADVTESAGVARPAAETASADPKAGSAGATPTGAAPTGASSTTRKTRGTPSLGPIEPRLAVLERFARDIKTVIMAAEKAKTHRALEMRAAIENNRRDIDASKSASEADRAIMTEIKTIFEEQTRVILGVESRVRQTSERVDPLQAEIDKMLKKVSDAEAQRKSLGKKVQKVAKLAVEKAASEAKSQAEKIIAREAEKNLKVTKTMLQSSTAKATRDAVDQAKQAAASGLREALTKIKTLSRSNADLVKQVRAAGEAAARQSEQLRAQKKEFAALQRRRERDAADIQAAVKQLGEEREKSRAAAAALARARADFTAMHKREAHAHALALKDLRSEFGSLLAKQRESLKAELMSEVRAVRQSMQQQSHQHGVGVIGQKSQPQKLWGAPLWGSGSVGSPGGAMGSGRSGRNTGKAVWSSAAGSEAPSAQLIGTPPRGRGSAMPGGDSTPDSMRKPPGMGGYRGGFEASGRFESSSQGGSFVSPFGQSRQQPARARGPQVAASSGKIAASAPSRAIGRGYSLWGAGGPGSFLSSPPSSQP